jgi:hypothetical protein
MRSVAERVVAVEPERDLDVRTDDVDAVDPALGYSGDVDGIGLGEPAGILELCCVGTSSDQVPGLRYRQGSHQCHDDHHDPAHTELGGRHRQISE